jgi:hypothetical protein
VINEAIWPCKAGAAMRDRAHTTRSVGGGALGEGQRVCGVGSAPGPRPRSGPGRLRQNQVSALTRTQQRQRGSLPLHDGPSLGSPRRCPFNGVTNRAVGAAGPPDRQASRRCKMASTAESWRLHAGKG